MPAQRSALVVVEPGIVFAQLSPEVIADFLQQLRGKDPFDAITGTFYSPCDDTGESA